MKKLFVLLILLLFFGRSQATDIEARTGILGGDGWGLQIGAYINFPQSTLFSIQTGVLLHTANRSAIGNSDTWDIDFNIPVYASFHIPLKEKANLRLNGGAYFGTGPEVQVGATAEVSVEMKRVFVGVNCFQNCINEQEFLFGLYVGYKFKL